MAKIKVINDKESVIYRNQIYIFGDEFEIEDTDVAMSLMERGYVEAVTDSPELYPEVETASVEAEGSLEEMSYQDLKKMASEMGIDASGKKNELIERIRNHVANSTIDETTDDEDPEEIVDEAPITSMPEDE